MHEVTYRRVLTELWFATATISCSPVRGRAVILTSATFRRPGLTPLLLNEGDAFLALHSLPHTATPNMSDDPRVNIYWRIRRLRPQNPHEGNRRVGWGVSDHPDRMMNGGFLEYDLEGYDPYAYSKEKLCDHWSEWDGMQGVVAEERAKAKANANAELAQAAAESRSRL